MRIAPTSGVNNIVLRIWLSENNILTFLSRYRIQCSR
jgi:hypothetical protein